MADLESLSVDELQAEFRRLYDAEAALATERKAVDRELGKRKRQQRAHEDAERVLAGLSPEARAVLIEGVTATVDADGKAGN